MSKKDSKNINIQAISCPPGGKLYTVQKGDTMYQIAKANGISLNCLIQYNPQVPNPEMIYPGQVICIPSKAQCEETPNCPPGGKLYTVQNGDTMYQIAMDNGIPLDCLIESNPQVTNPNVIFPGQVLCIPPKAQCDCPPGGKLYTVQNGDTMYQIAMDNDISLDCLIEYNPQVTNPNVIFPGQVLCIPPASACNTSMAAESSDCSPARYYMVQPGDTMYKIAKCWGISLDCLITYNKQFSDPSQIQVGDYVLVPW